MKRKFSAQAIENIRQGALRKTTGVGSKGYKHKPETIEKMRQARKRLLERGWHVSEKHKEALRRLRLGTTLAVSHRQKISQSLFRFYKKHKCTTNFRKQPWYINVHDWIRSQRGRPDHCDMCGRKEQPPNMKRNYFEWSNKSHEYRRDVNDWWQLCIPCHQKYDQRVFVPVKPDSGVE